MAKLGGRSIITRITSLEVRSDDESLVATFQRGAPDDKLSIKLRKPWESFWNGSGPTFTVSARDARALALVVGSSDAQYERTLVEELEIKHFEGVDPGVAETEKAEVEARCTELDIERAKAANLIEEKANLLLQLRIDHSHNQHNPRIEGCPSCESEIFPGHGDGSLTHRTYDPDDDSTKTPERGYGEPDSL